MIATIRVAVVAVAMFAGTGCTWTAPPETARELAEALERRGIAYESAEPIDFSTMRYAKIDEGLGLAGENLRIEILRIEDPRTFGVVSEAGFLLRMLGDRIDGGALVPPDTYIRRPFVVVIRQEPEPGKTRRALQAILPEEPEN